MTVLWLYLDYRVREGSNNRQSSRNVWWTPERVIYRGKGETHRDDGNDVERGEMGMYTDVTVVGRLQRVTRKVKATLPPHF